MARLSKTGVVGTCAVIVGVAFGTSTLTGARQTAAARQPPVSPSSSSSPSPQQPASPPQPVTADQPRLRIATTAVEIDAVVTTRSGAQVTDLRPEDLELFQDGRKQQISSLRYVALPALRPDVRPDSNAPEDVRRTVAIVIDDLNMSFGSMHYTREALLKFVDTQIQPGDRVAVIRGDYEGTRTEWFSADKQALREKIRSIRYNLMTTSALTGAGQEQITAFDSALDLQREAFTIGTLGTVNAIVRAMRDMPGRKALVLASDGFQLRARRSDLRAGCEAAPAGVPHRQAAREPAERPRPLPGRVLRRLGQRSPAAAVESALARPALPDAVRRAATETVEAQPFAGTSLRRTSPVPPHPGRSSERPWTGPVP